MSPTLPEQLDALLAKLKSSIRRYVLLRGLAMLLTAIVAVFWLSLLADSAWFRLTRLELPRETRLAILIACLALLVIVLFHGIVWQLMVQLKRKALALLLERRFPQLNDRLITVVETAEETESAVAKNERAPLSQTMLDRTIHEACRLMESLRIEEVFNPLPLRRAALLATIAGVSLAATAVASPGTFSHWSNAYVKLADDYWNRVNGLEVFVLAQPGDRIRPFENRVCKHASGSDLTILVTTMDGKLTPAQVLLNYRGQGDTRGRALMTPAGEGKFRHTIGNLMENLEFTITGGDFTTAQPYHIVATPEPGIETLVAECNYPAYTGWNDPGHGEERLRRIVSSELTVPMETELDLQAKSTKPLAGARIIARDFELQIWRDSQQGSVTSMYRQLDERGLPTMQVPIQPTSEDLISADGLQLKLPLRITSSGRQSENSTPELPPPSGEMSRVSIHESETLRIYLEDLDGIINLEPVRVELHGRPDESPVVQTRLAGIGKAITRKAIMPFQGVVTDDYGLDQLNFEYRVGTEAELRQQTITRQPGGTQRFVMEKSESQPLEKFDVLPLELKVDDVLLIGLVARDADNLNGPHVSRGEIYRMKIVSEEALLSLLYQDELNLRRRFEQVIEEITRSRDDLQQALPGTEEQPTPRISEAVQRSLNTIQKDSIETDAIRAAFESIHEEIINNRIDTPQIRNRLEGKIIQPLRATLENEFQLAEEHLRLLDFSLRRAQATSITPEQCIANLDALLSSLAQILLEMRKLESFQEVIELLKGIIEEEKRLKQKTEEERKKKLIDLLN